MTIKKCTAEDLEEIAQLFNAYRIFYDQESDLSAAKAFIQERLSHNDSVIFLANDIQNMAAGFVQLYPSFTSVGMEKIWILNDLYVDKNHRRKGVAQLLMNHAKEYAKETARVKLVLETGLDNQKAQLLYESQGWTKETSIIYSIKV